MVDLKEVVLVGGPDRISTFRRMTQVECLAKIIKRNPMRLMKVSLKPRTRHSRDRFQIFKSSFNLSRANSTTWLLVSLRSLYRSSNNLGLIISVTKVHKISTLYTNSLSQGEDSTSKSLMLQWWWCLKESNPCFNSLSSWFLDSLDIHLLVLTPKAMLLVIFNPNPLGKMPLLRLRVFLWNRITDSSLPRKMTLLEWVISV